MDDILILNKLRSTHSVVKLMLFRQKHRWTHEQKLKNELCGNLRSSELVMTEYTGSINVVVHD